MSKDADSYFERDMKCVNADQEANAFLAEIIPNDDGARIRKKFEDSDFSRKQHTFLGMNVENLLRAGNFSCLLGIMDAIWFSWFKKAVCLLENEVVLTDLPKRVEKYQADVEQPRLCPKLEEGEIERIIRQLEERHKIKLSRVEVKYSDNIRRSFCVPPTHLPSEKIIRELHFMRERVKKFHRIRKSKLKFRGLTDSEIEEIDASKFTVFLGRKYANCSAGLYCAAWHELGHVVAFVHGIKARIANESIALAYSFRGLLQGAKEGRFTLEKAVDLIELDIGIAQDPLTNVFTHYDKSLEAIREFNPDLKFRNRDLNELLLELDKTIDYTLAYPFAYEQKRWEYEKIFIYSVALAAITSFTISLALTVL